MPLLMCPNCEIGMKEVTRNGVQIDICPQCRSVWLDRGELEKMLESMRQVDADWEMAERDYRERPQYHGRHEHGPYYGKRKKKPRLKDIFEIFD